MQLTAVVLNAGLGELSIGLEQSGFKITAAYESDEKARSIYELNMVIEPLPLEEIDAKSVPEADLLAASDNWFSSAGADGLCCGNSSGTWQEF